MSFLAIVILCVLVVFLGFSIKNLIVSFKEIKSKKNQNKNKEGS